MADFLGLLASIAVWVFIWKAVSRSRSTQHYGRFIRHGLGAVAGYLFGVIALLFVIAGMHWLAFATAAGLCWFAIYRKQPAPEPLAPEDDDDEPVQLGEPIDHEPRTIDEWNADLVTIWAGAPIAISFTYQNNDGDRSRRRVDVDEIQRDHNGEIYLTGFCHRRNENRTFRASRIQSDISINGRRLDPFEWIEETTGLPT